MRESCELLQENSGIETGSISELSLLPRQLGPFVWRHLDRWSSKWIDRVNLFVFVNVVLISSSFYSLIWVWEWLKALLLSVCCTLCGSFKAWPYQSWHLTAKENAGQACSRWGSCHQTIAMWNNGYITWIHPVWAASLLPSIPLSRCLKLEAVLWGLSRRRTPPSHSFPYPLWYFFWEG